MKANRGQQLPEAERFSLGFGRYAPYVEYPATTEPNGETIALFHGISMPPTHWGDLPHELADLGYRSVAIGLGKSALRGCQFQIPTLDAYARDAAKVMDGVIGEPAHILGLSWGGVLVQQIALDHPDKVKSVIAAATIPMAPLPFVHMPDFRAVMAVATPWRSEGSIGDIYGGDFRTNPELAKQYSHLVKRSIDPMSHYSQQLALSLSSITALRMLGERMIGGNNPETTFLYGSDDPIIPAAYVEEAASMLGARVKVKRIKNGGHGFLLTRPEESAQLIDSILSSNP